jgi:hypothetical protein
VDDLERPVHRVVGRVQFLRVRDEQPDRRVVVREGRERQALGAQQALDPARRDGSAGDRRAVDPRLRGVQQAIVDHDDPVPAAVLDGPVPEVAGQRAERGERTPECEADGGDGDGPRERGQREHRQDEDAAGDEPVPAAAQQRVAGSRPTRRRDAVGRFTVGDRHRRGVGFGPVAAVEACEQPPTVVVAADPERPQVVREFPDHQPDQQRPRADDGTLSGCRGVERDEDEQQQADGEQVPERPEQHRPRGVVAVAAVAEELGPRLDAGRDEHRQPAREDRPRDGGRHVRSGQRVDDERGHQFERDQQAARCQRRQVPEVDGRQRAGKRCRAALGL